MCSNDEGDDDEDEEGPRIDVSVVLVLEGGADAVMFARIRMRSRMLLQQLQS